MKKILITGASGFVGQHLISLLADKYKIVGLSNTEAVSATKNVEYLKGDLLDPEFLDGLLNRLQPDVIVHLAGIAQTHHIETDLLFKVNFFGVYNLLEAVKKVGNYSPKILQISSADIYGKTNNPKNITEESLLNPINYYAVSKLAGDRLAYQYSQSQKLKIAIFRPFPHIGTFQRKGFFVPDMASQIVEIEKDPTRDEIKVGNLEAVRDYLDVRDVVRAYQLAIEKDFTPGEAFNISSGKGVKIADILDMLLSLSFKKIRVVKDKERMRPSEVPFLIGNPGKMKKVFGWEAKIDIKQTLNETLEYWRTLK